jgi:predicted nucleic acid-binding protein
MTTLGAGGISVLDLSLEDIPRLHQLMEKYRDLPMDLADASLVLAAETLGSGDILSTDQRDFKTYRWKTHRPFRNLMEGPDALKP